MPSWPPTRRTPRASPPSRPWSAASGASSSPRPWQSSTVASGERLQDSRARIEGLLSQLATTTSNAERAAVEAELRSERARAAALRSRLAALNRRANLSRVSLRIETGEASGSGSTDGSWGVSDGFHDAGRILAIAAGVTVVGLAIITPLALLFLLAWLLRRTWIRTRREQALSRRV